MDATQALVLGVVQGISEFLPISSTAHLILVPWFMHFPDPGLTFDVALHVGTFLAVVSYFWKDLSEMLGAWLRSFRKMDLMNDPMQRLAWLVLLGSVPAALAGVVLEKKIETVFRSPFIIAGTMIGVAVLLGLAEIFGRKLKDIKQIRLPEALLVGVAQACALIPGTSRSGATMTMAMGLGYTREAAARFSFLLGTPIIFGSCVFKARGYVKHFQESVPGLHGKAMLHALGSHVVHSPNLMPFVIGVVASTVVGYLSIRFLLAFLQKRSMAVFIAYRLGLGALILFLVLTHRLPAEMDLG